MCALDIHYFKLIYTCIYLIISLQIFQPDCIVYTICVKSWRSILKVCGGGGVAGERRSSPRSTSLSSSSSLPYTVCKPDSQNWIESHAQIRRHFGRRSHTEPGWIRSHRTSCRASKSVRNKNREKASMFGNNIYFFEGARAKAWSVAQTFKVWYKHTNYGTNFLSIAQTSEVRRSKALHP